MIRCFFCGNAISAKDETRPVCSDCAKNQLVLLNGFEFLEADDYNPVKGDTLAKIALETSKLVKRYLVTELTDLVMSED